MAGSPWQPHAMAVLVQMWHAGATGSEIAKRLGTTRNAVINKVRRLKLPIRPPPAFTLRSYPIKAVKPQSPQLPEHRLITGSTLPPLLSGVVMPSLSGGAFLPNLRAVLSPKSAPAVSTVLCRWPIGHPRTPAFRFCSEPALFPKSYCADHCSTAYLPVLTPAIGATPE